MYVKTGFDVFLLELTLFAWLAFKLNIFYVLNWWKVNGMLVVAVAVGMLVNHVVVAVGMLARLLEGKL